MTVLEKEIPYMCIYKVTNGTIASICDEQCTSCKNAESLKGKTVVNE